MNMQAPSDDLQPEDRGYGPYFIRRYAVTVAQPVHDAAAVMAKLKEDINLFSPQQNACFIKSRGEPNDLRVGDEFAIEICGPNDGTVVVTDVQDHSFTFHTLKGHPEAGSITFSVIDEGGKLVFTIESHARSRDMLTHLMYHTLKVGKAKQEETWSHFCNAVACFAEGEQGEVQVTTYRCDDEQMTVCTFEDLVAVKDEAVLEKVKERDSKVRESKDPLGNGMEPQV